MKTHTTETQVCIVGAGVMGASAAFQLSDQGQDVLLLERSVAGLQASGANAGTLAVQNKKLDVIPLVLRSIDLWETLSERLEMDVEYEQRGGFRLAHTDEEVEVLQKAVLDQRARGADVEMVFPPRLFDEAPYLSRDIKAGSYCPRDGMANPLATTRAFLAAARRRGARLWQHAAVTKIEVHGDRDFTVHCERGSVRCSFVIIAAGTWIRNIARMVGVDLPITTAVLQVGITAPGPFLFPHIVTHVRGNLTLKQQRTTGKVILGGGWPGEGDPERRVKRVARESLIGHLSWIAETIPGIGQRNLLRSWVGFEGRTPDKMLLSGSLGPAGLTVIGCSGGGFTLSPVAGQIAADYVVNGRTQIADRLFDVLRFKASSTQHAEGSDEVVT
jgi:glycine/D-amino acid oxidase-like deaminating enzyme